MTKVTITYNKVRERCKMLSAFDGQNLSDSNGESRYAELRMTDRERTYMMHYIEQGMNMIETSIGKGISIEAMEENEAETATLFGSAPLRRVGRNQKIVVNIEQALSCYVLQYWFEDKDTSRSASYKQMFADMLESVRRMVYRKKEPDWDEEEQEETPPSTEEPTEEETEGVEVEYN